MTALRPAIYLDHHASAPLSDAARAAVMALMAAGPGNPSSIHGAGQAARHALDRARGQVAAAVGVAPRQVVFTSGATEANHGAIRGVALAKPRAAGAGVAGVGVAWISAAEHASVHAAAATLAVANGAVAWEIRAMGLDPLGFIDLEAIAAALHAVSPGLPRPAQPSAPQTTHLVSACLVSNELGTTQPVAALGRLFKARDPDVIIHCDATQALGRIAVDFAALGVDLLTLSGHKIGAPAGIGALIVRDGLAIDVLLPGHQEEGRRAGTENLLGAVGLGAACADLAPRRAQIPRIRGLRDALWRGIDALPWPSHRHAQVAAERETGTCLSVAFPGCDASDLVMALDVEGVAVSAGSACSSGTLAPSAVIEAILSDADQALAAATVRFSLGPESTANDVTGALTALRRVLTRVAPAPAPD